MKQIQYTGSSKLISRIVHLLNRKAPLPLDGQGDAVWGTNGQVLTTDGQGNTSWTTPQGGGGDVTDVEVNGTSVVNAQGVAEVTVPTKTSDLNNDSGFITNLVNDLANYYTKSQTYTQAEVNQLISGIVTLNILVVQALPTQDISTTTIYLVPKQDTGTSDIYDEYLYINNAWELIGTTQIDLSNYVTTTDLSTALADYVTSVGLATILADYVQSSDLATVATSGDYSDLQNKPTIPDELADLADDSTHRTVTDTQISTWNGKSDFSGSYNDLTDKPTIPTVNDGTLTIQQNGTTLGTFTANQSGNTTVNLTGGGSTYTEGDGIDISAQDVISVDTTFTDASTRTNIASGDTFSTILGKIKKFFSDLKTVAFTGKSSDLDNDAGFITSSGSITGNAATATKATQDGSGNVITSTYVKKSGDTMTGALTVQRNSDTPLILERTDSNGKTYVAFRNTSGIIGYFAVGNDKKPYFYDNADRRIALLEEVTSGYIPYIFGGSKYQAYADGSHQWFRMAILTVTGTYLNAPITFEVSSRGRGRHSQISVMFSSAGNTDPGLSSITTDFDPSWYIKKTDPSTWELYVNTGGGWNSAWIHRCFGKYLNGGVTVTFPVDALSAAPTGTTQASYGGNVDYAKTSGACTGNAATATTAGVAQTIRTGNDYGYVTDANGNLTHRRATSGDYLCIKSNSNAEKFGIYYENGGFFSLGIGYFVNGSYWSQIWSNANGTLCLKSASNWLNLQANTQIQCRNGADSGWVPIAASSYPGTGSSRKVKENIKPLTEDEAKKILDIETVTFDYKETHIADKSRFGWRGVIAEDVEPIIPSAVVYGVDKYGEPCVSSVDYMRFVPYLIKMTQMQQAQIDELKAEIALLKGEKA